MNTIITSKEAILDKSRQLVTAKGWSAVSIRTVAAACGVSVGSIYNYFESKSDLIAATVESIWHELFHFSERQTEFDSFSECVLWIFNSIKTGSEKYPGFFASHSMHFLGDDKTDGKQRMAQSWEHIQTELFRVLEKDTKIRPNAFDETLTAQKFVDIVFSLIISALLRQNYDDSGILELIKRIIYE
ncbi:MAG: TetR/AcrR family transcriptional regulator [Lachnospiraceae bacterium]|nr:TetR/AcrR family transcriptional regulator [Lachnospiraceae bacterium]